MVLAFALVACNGNKTVDIQATSEEICECLGGTEGLDSLKFAKCYQTIFYEKTEGISDENELNRINTQIVKNLGKTCKAAVLSENAFSDNSDIRLVEEDRIPVLSVEDCRKFTEQAGLYYIETFGDSTRVEIKDGEYLENFKDGSFSKLGIRWTEGCQFELTFIRSNNPIKKDFSTPGEIYKYKVIDKKEDERFYVLHSYPSEFIFEFMMRY